MEKEKEKETIDEIYKYLNLMNKYDLFNEILKNFIEEYKELNNKQFNLDTFLNIKENKEEYKEEEYKSDYQCPYCKEYKNIIKTVQIRASDEPEDIMLTCLNKECTNFNKQELIRD